MLYTNFQFDSKYLSLQNLKKSKDYGFSYQFHADT